MDHDVIVEQWLDRCKGFIANILQAPDLHSVASASLAIFAPMRQVARDMLQAKMTLEAQERTRADVTPCCQEAGVTFVHTRTVSPATWCGAITSPVRTVQCHGGGALCRPDDRPLGVPEAGDFTDDGRALSAPGAAELPHRVASALLQQGTGVALSSGGAQGIIDSTAEDLRTWHAKRERREAAAVADALASGDGTADLRVEIAREGVTTHLDGRWPQPQVATSLVRQLDTQTEEPTLGVLLARRDVCVRGPAAERATGIPQALQEAGGPRRPRGEIWGDGAPGIWPVADAYVPGVRQTLDDDHLSAHL